MSGLTESKGNASFRSVRAMTRASATMRGIRDAIVTVNRVNGIARTVYRIGGKPTPAMIHKVNKEGWEGRTYAIFSELEGSISEARHLNTGSSSPSN